MENHEPTRPRDVWSTRGGGRALGRAVLRRGLRTRRLGDVADRDPLPGVGTIAELLQALNRAWTARDGGHHWRAQPDRQEAASRPESRRREHDRHARIDIRPSGIGRSWAGELAGAGAAQRYARAPRYR